MSEIGHLALVVSNPDASLAFYRDVFGLRGWVREADDGVVLTTPAGFVLAFVQGRPADLGMAHFGFRLSGAEAVEARRREFAARGLREVAWWEEPGLTSLKVADPDGYVVEFFADTRRPV
ncbi:MAG TPA: VOC family protein [Actinomycetota bacterium]|nr:VOC family protein [Actinomycetota bacterium]